MGEGGNYFVMLGLKLRKKSHVFMTEGEGGVQFGLNLCDIIYEKSLRVWKKIEYNGFRIFFRPAL